MVVTSVIIAIFLTLSEPLTSMKLAWFSIFLLPRSSCNLEMCHLIFFVVVVVFFFTCHCPGAKLFIFRLHNRKLQIISQY